MIDDILKVLLLSLIEGLTEFLPVSSTGHLVLGKALLDYRNMDGLFEISIQFGAVLAILVYYRRTLRQHLRQLQSSAAIRRFWLLVAISSLPTAAIGFVYGEAIARVLFQPAVVALSLITGGLIFLLVERQFARGTLAPEPRQVTEISLWQACVIGLLQVFALVPGASRSGSSIIAGMLAGLPRAVATEFSFFLAIPLLGGATLFRLFTSLDSIDGADLAMLALGMLLSGIFAWLTIGWLLRYISRHSFVAFGIYRIIAGVVVLLAIAAGWLS